MRIAKYLAACGLGSRRKAEDLVSNGRVTINDEIVKDLGRQVDPSTDVVFVDGESCAPLEKVYYLLNKPVGYTSSLADPHAEKLITELIPNEPPVWPVGRLDRETAGLIILSNDGELTQKITHPSHQKVKEYLVKTDLELTDKELNQVLEGIKLDDGPFKADGIKRFSENIYLINIHEGRNRLVRRVFDHFGATVTELTRTRIAFLELADLKTGEYRSLTNEEVRKLKDE